MTATFITARPSRRSVAAAASIGAALVIGCGAVLTVAHNDLPHIPEVLVAYDAALVMLSVMTAYLLFGQFMVSGSASVAVLATGYLTTGLLQIENLLFFPNVFLRQDLFQVDPSSPVWVWLICHVVFPAAVCLYAIAEAGLLPLRSRQIGLVAAACAGVAVLIMAGVFWLVTAGVHLLPPLPVAKNHVDLTTSRLGPAAWALNLAALGLLTLRLRCRSLVQLWLAVAVLASLLDVTVTLYAPERYSAGWYLSRVISLVATGVVLAAMLREMTLLYARVADLNDRLEQMAITDGLTGLANRRHFNMTLDREWRQARRNQNGLTLLMIDIDWFKGYNDRLGHLAGDDCLRRVAAAIASGVRRPSDLAARYGGEEFAVILPGTDEAGGLTVAERIRAAVTGLGLRHPVTGKPVSVSIGVSTTRPAPDAAEAGLVAASDAALYRAKDSGRTRVVAHQPAMHAPGTDRAMAT